MSDSTEGTGSTESTKGNPSPYDPTTDGWKQVGRHGFIKLLGPMFTRRVGDTWEYAILLDERHLNPAGVVHGGVLMSLVDSAISLVAWEATGRVTALTAQLDSHFMGSAYAGDFVIGRAEVMKKTSSLVFLRGTLSVRDETIMSALAVMKIMKPRPNATPGDAPSP